MKENTKGKIFVGMIISVLAFGLATGTGIFIGANPLNTIGVMNLTHQGEFPVIPSTPNTGTTNNLNTSTTPTKQVTQQTTTTPNTGNSSGSNKSPKTNQTSGNQVNSTG